MLLDTSFHGFGKALLSGAKVFAWVIGSSAVAAGGTVLIQMITDLGVGHPEYVVYAGAGIALVNSVLVVINKWLTAIRPTSVPVYETQATQLG